MNENRKKILSMLADEIIDFYDNVSKLKVSPTISPKEIKSYLNSKFDFAKPRDLSSVIKDVETMLRKWNLHVTHPHYFGLYCPSVTFASIIADTLVALYNPQLASWNHSPVGNEIEQFTLGFFLKKFGFDTKNSIAHFTTGGAESNLTATVVALTSKFPEYGNFGLKSLKGQPVFYVSKEAHHSFIKIAHITGLGRNSIRTIKTSKDYTMNTEDLYTQITKDKSNGDLPFMVVGTAGTTSAGMIDPLKKISEITQSSNLWFHVDAAWGGAAILSSNLSGYLDGISKADSITFDAHKWLSVTMGAGMFFCRHKEPVVKSFSSDATYMPVKVETALDYYTTSLQWSRRFIGLKLFMTLSELGEDGLRKMIEKQSSLGKYLSKLLKENNWEIISESPLAVVCFTHPSIKGNLRIMRNLVNQLNSEGKVWISTVILAEKTPALRACITSFRSEKSDVEILVTELDKTLKKIQKNLDRNH